MKHIIYIIATALLLIIFSQSVSTSAFSLRRKKTKTEQADTTRQAADTLPQLYTDSAAFMARNRETMSRLVDNLRAISSPRNEAAIRAYLSRQTMDLFDLRADSIQPVQVMSDIDSCSIVRLMPVADFLAYLESQTDSVPRILQLQIPAFARGGYSIADCCECSSTLMRDSAGNLVPAGEGNLCLRCCWEPTVYGYEPVPQFGAMVVKMTRMPSHSVLVEKDTIEGRYLPVYVPVL